VQAILARMDQRDEGKAVLAMREAAKMLRSRNLSFRKLIERLEARRLLLPSRIATAIQMMDSTTANEAESAFGAVRRMMAGCGLSFARIAEALEQETVDIADFERVCSELRAEVARVRRLQMEVAGLRVVSRARAFSSPLLSNSLVVVVAGAVLLWWFTMDQSTKAAAVAPPAPPARAAVVVPLYAPPTHQPVRRDEHDGRSCWRDRSISGPCF
jgi:hypothetical protein